MKEILKILHIEDNTLDAELIKEKISAEWKENIITVIADKKKLKKEIENKEFDLVLCDYKVPGFNTGLEALEIIRETTNDIPVLFVSGTIGEELAVELLKKGATDYVLKDNLVRLIPSIKRALEEKRIRLEKNAARKALEESEARYKNLFLNSPVGIYRSTPDGQIILANPFLLKLLGYSSFEELERRNRQKGDFLEKNERKRYNEIMEKNNEVIGFETIWRNSKGIPVYILENSKAVRNENGRVLYYEGTIQDLSEKKAAYDALKKSEEQLTLAQETASMGNWEMDLLWEGFSMSKGMYKIYGITPGEVKINKNLLYEFVHPDDKSYVKSKIENEILEKKEGISFHYRILRAGGDLRILFCILRTNLLSGNVRSVSGIVQDVTEQKKTEEELIEAKKRSEESDRLKTEFLAQISHEIRTPLNTLFNLSHLVNVEIKKEGNEDIQSLFDHIDSTGRRLLRTLELILNVATINTTSYSLILKPVNLEKVINEIIDKYRNRINKKNLEINLLYTIKDKYCTTDEYLLAHILDNIIFNAVKYTDEGEIEINVSQAGNSVIFKIKDTGIGISEEYLPNLFKPFTQESTGYTRRYEGNGLGLTLTKKFIEILNGDIHLHTKKGEGTTFTISLPLSSNQ